MIDNIRSSHDLSRDDLALLLSTDDKETLDKARISVSRIGYDIVVDRGDFKS